MASLQAGKEGDDRGGEASGKAGNARWQSASFARVAGVGHRSPAPIFPAELIVAQDNRDDSVYARIL